MSEKSGSIHGFCNIFINHRGRGDFHRGPQRKPVETSVALCVFFFVFSVVKISGVHEFLNAPEKRIGVLTPRLMNGVLAVFALLFMMSCAQFDKNVMTASYSWKEPYQEVRRGVESISLGKYSTLLITEEDSLIEKRLGEIRPDVIVTFGTGSMYMLREKTDVPIVLVTWMFPCEPPPNVAVAPIVVSPDKQMEIISEGLPEIRHIGFMYSDRYAPILAAELWDAAQKRGLRATAVKVGSGAEALATMRELAGKTDALLMIADLVAYPLELRTEMIRISAELKYPVITFDRRTSENGAVLSIIPSYFEVGLNAAGLGKKIFEGSTPDDLPRLYAKHPKILLDYTVAESMGIKVNRWAIARLGNRPLMYDMKPSFTYPYYSIIH